MPIVQLFFVLTASVKLANLVESLNGKCSSGSQPFRSRDGSFLKCPKEESLKTDCKLPYKCDENTSYCCPFPFFDSEMLAMEHPQQQRAVITHLESDEDHDRYCGKEGRLFRVAHQTDQEAVLVVTCAMRIRLMALSGVAAKILVRGVPLEHVLSNAQTAQPDVFAGNSI
uniref:Uncharacterized protein n=1 Tax=Ditylenchus dipsaci TaxID=166011 RepID=A0A915CSP7_9BILA